MKNFEDKIAVVTGGGTGMGRELVCQLVAAGAVVAMCDLSHENMDETRRLAAAGEGRLSDHICDVSSEEQVMSFRDAVLATHQTQHINLLFNNAGIGGGGSFVEGDRGEWDRTFAVCWEGVYFGCRAFMDALVASDEGHIINTSSVNGFWASLGTTQAHTSYAAAKFAVKGFTEALVTDLRLHAPHVQCSVVMPGHIGTSIMENSSKVLGKPWGHDLPDEEVEVIRQRMLAAGLPVGNVPDDHIRQMLADRAEAFRTQAPTTAGEAANVILDGVRSNQWRILIGQDAHDLDRLVREAPEEAYEKSFVEKLNELKHLGGLL